MKLDKRVLMKFLPVVLFFVSIGAVMLFIKFNHKPVDPDSLPKYDNPLSEVNIISQGDINGGYSRLIVERSGSLAVILSEFAEKEGYPAKRQRYLVSADVLTEIENMFYQNGMIEWEKREEKKHSSADLVGYSLTFKFGTEFTKFSSKQIPSRNNSLSDLIALIEAYEKNENSDVILKDVFVENGMSIFELKNGYLDSALINGASEDRTALAEYELFKNNNGNWNRINFEYDIEPAKFIVPAGSQASVQFDLNAFGKLEAGEYRIVSGEAFAEFSVE